MNENIDKYFKKPDRDLINILKDEWKIFDLNLIGQFTKIPNQNFGFFNDVRKEQGQILLYPNRIGRVSVFTHITRNNQNIELEDGKYYSFHVKLSSKNERIKNENPFALIAANNRITEIRDEALLHYIKHNNPTEIEHKQKKEDIEELHNTLSDASPKILNGYSELLKNFQIEMYTVPERFIFELIQNADDMPTERSQLHVNFKLLNEHLLLFHNGKAFSYNNVDALCDTANSTKKADATKTGYKGVGFKSVFSDAYRVFLYSGGYSFRFDKFANKNNNKLWQIKPIWTEIDDYPNDIKNYPTFFNDEKHNVAFALEVGAFNIKKYKKIFIELFTNPTFLIFLRNLHFINIVGLNKNVGIERVFKNNFCQFKKYEVESEKYETIATYYIKRYEVKVSKDIQMTLRHSEKVPIRLLNSDSVEISFVAKVEKDNVLPINDAIIFNYLPTRDTNYGFKFFINGDFLLNNSREFVQANNNPWNEFLFENIGYYVFKWIEETIEQDSNLAYSIYRIIPPRYTEVDELKNAFNRGFDKALQEIPFILTIDNELKKADEVIIDKAEISKHFGSELFYLLFGSDLKIVHHDIDVSKVSNKDFGIKKIEISDFCERLKAPEGLKIFNEWIENLDLKQYEDFIGILNDKYLSDRTRDRKLFILDEELNFQSTFWSVKIFIGTNKSYYSANELYDNHNIIPRIQPTFKILKQLIKLDFVSTPLKIDTKENIYSAIEGKIKKHETIFELLNDRIETIDNNQKLSPLDKKQILESFMSRETKLNGVSRNQISKLEIFFNSEMPIKILSPTNELLSRSTENKYPEWLESFQICEEEYYPEIDNYNFFISDSEIYTKIIFPYWSQLTQYVIEENYPINQFYDEVIKYYKIANKEGENELTSLNEKAYVYGQGLFLKKEDVFYHSYLSKSSQFETLKSGIKKVLNINIPEISIIEFLTKEPFNLKRTSDNNQLLIQNIEAKIDELTEDEIRELFLLIQTIDVEKAPTMELFHDQQGKIKSLNKLLSCANQELPYWLDDFKIAKSQYHSDYETLFLQSDVYSEIILPHWKSITDKLLSIDNPDITLFYKQITDEFYVSGKQVVSDSNSNRAFIYDGSTFELKEGVFWHPSFSLAEAAIEKLTNRKLPYVSIVRYLENVNSPFHIALVDNLLELLVSGTTDLTQKEALSFIDFAIKTNARIFDKGYFDGSNNYNVGKEVVQFNLPELNTFITKHFEENYYPISVSLAEDNDLSKLGLIPNDDLKTVIISKLTQKQQFTDLIDLVVSWGDSFKKQFWSQYESSINKVQLSTDNSYSQQSFEYKLLKLFLSIYNSDEDANNLRERISINEIILADIETKEDIDIGDVNLPYNTIIKAEDNSKWIDKFIADFNDSELESQFFYKRSEDIHTTADLLKATAKFADLDQYVFAIYYAKENDNNYLSCFENPYSEVELINHFYTQKYPFELLKSFLKLWNRNYVHPELFAIKEVEYLPAELKSWHKEEQEKLTYLSKLGLNDVNSNIVKLRKHLKNPEFKFDILRLPTNMVLLKNTLKWIENENIVITQQAYEAISKVYNLIPEYKPDIPVLIYNTTENETHTYKLKTTLSNPVIGFEALNGKTEAFKLLNNCDIVCGIHQIWMNGTCKKIEINQKPDIQKLAHAQKQSDAFQEKWEQETNLELYFYHGQIPYLDYIVGYETKSIADSDKTTEIDIVENKIFVNKEQQNNLRNLFTGFVEEEKVAKYFLWEKAFRLLRYLKQENTDIEIDFAIKDLKYEQLSFILNEMQGYLFNYSGTKPEMIKEIFHYLKGYFTEIIAVYKSIINESFSYQLINTKNKKLLSGLTDCDVKHYSKILEISSNQEYYIVADYCKDFVQTPKIEISENQLNLSIDELKQWKDEKWQSWQYKDKYTIKLHSGKIPLKTTFLNESITEYEGGNKFRVSGSNTIIVNAEAINDLHIWLKDELSDEEYTALFTKHVKADETIVSKSEYEEFQRWKKKSHDDNSKSNHKKNDSKSKNNYSERFQEIAILLNPDLADDIKRGSNFEAKAKILEWLEISNNILPIENQELINEFSFIRNVKYKLNNTPKTIIAKSTLKSNLNINPSEWIELSKDNSMMIVWSGNESFEVINNQQDVLDKNPRTLIRMDSDENIINKLEEFAQSNKYISSFKFVFNSPLNVSDEVSKLKATNENIDMDFDDNYLDNLDLQ